MTSAAVDGFGSDADAVGPMEQTRFQTMMARRLAGLSDPGSLADAFASFDEKDEGFVDVQVVKELLADDPARFTADLEVGACLTYVHEPFWRTLLKSRIFTSSGD